MLCYRDIYHELFQYSIRDACNKRYPNAKWIIPIHFQYSIGDALIDGYERLMCAKEFFQYSTGDAGAIGQGDIPARLT